DCFAIAELIAYEELGFCRKGEAGAFVAAGRSDYGGDVVVNPRGGLIGCGHPLGATGVAQAAEAFGQLREEAGARQGPGAAAGCVTTRSSRRPAPRSRRATSPTACPAPSASSSPTG